MNRYTVWGTIEINFSVEVEAENEDEAEEMAKEFAYEGEVTFHDPVGEAEITSIKKEI